MSIGFSSSSYKSAIKNTSFVGDSFLYNGSESAKKKSKIEFEKKKSIKFKINSSNKGKDNKDENLLILTNNKAQKLINIEEEKGNENNNIINNKNKDNELIIKNDNNSNNKEEKEKKELNEENLLDQLSDSKTNKSSEIFRDTDLNSFTTQKVLSKENLSNLKFLIFLIFFYSFSISYLIPKIMIYILLYFGNKNDICFYGVIISIILIGNLFSKLLLKKYFNNSFKLILVISSFFMLLYYILLTLGIFLKYIYLIIIGRFFLGFSILNHLAKIYVNHYVPISNQIKANQRHNFYINFGFFFGFLLNSLDFLQWKKIVNEFDLLILSLDFIKIIIIICLLISLSIFILIIIYFKEPTKYSLLHQLLIDLNQRHRLSKNFLVQNEEKKNTDELDQDYSLVNDSSFAGQTNDLEQLIETHINTPKYYRKTKTILFLLLISAEYTRENLLLLIPRLLSYNIYIDDDITEKIDGDECYMIIVLPICFAFTFLISYLLQKYSLVHKQKKVKNLIIIIVLLFILNISFFSIILETSITTQRNLFVIISAIEIFFMMILNEVYRAIIINLFIKLLPSEEIKLGCCKISFAIDFITKIVKIFPALIIYLFSIFEGRFLDKFLLNENSTETCYSNCVLLGLQILLYLLCFIICIFNPTSLKRSYRNRILSLKKKKLNNNKNKLNNI